MATPVYNAAWRNSGGYSHPGGYEGRGYGGRGYGHGRTWGIVTGNGSMLGGNTPPYLGGGQPPSEDSGTWFGDGTPVYRTVPPPTTTSTAMTTPSTTASDPTAPPPAPQPGQMAIIVPRS
jgi:hypothetical protein